MAARSDEWGQLATILQKVAPQIYHPEFTQHATMRQRRESASRLPDRVGRAKA